MTELLTGWRRHGGVVKVASRLGWVIVVLDVVRLAMMVPLYLGGQVAALGVAKIALGWPAYLLAVAGHRCCCCCAATPRSTTPTPRRPDAG